MQTKGNGFSMSDRVDVRHDGIYVDNKKLGLGQYRWIDDPLPVALALVAIGITGLKIGLMIATRRGK